MILDMNTTATSDEIIEMPDWVFGDLPVQPQNIIETRQLEAVPSIRTINLTGNVNQQRVQ